MTTVQIQDMKVGDNSKIINERYVVVRISQTQWRLGELFGAWIMRGTAHEVLARASK